MNWLKIKMFKPNVFGCLPSSGLKKNDDRYSLLLLLLLLLLSLFPDFYICRFEAENIYFN